MQVISFLNNKGGVGKTTLCSNIAQALAITGKKVLCIDNDNQHSLSNRLQIPVGAVNIRTLYRDYGAAEDFVPFLEKGIFQTAIPRLHCLTSTFGLLNADVKVMKTLRNLIHNSEISSFYDFVFIDNHPGLDMLQQAAILASDRFFIPVFLKQQSLEGLSELVTFLHRLQVPEDRITILPNYHEGLKHDTTMLGVLQKMFPESTAKTFIPKDRSIEEVENLGKILFLDRLMTAKSVPYLIKLITELFPDDYEETKLKQTMATKRSQYLGRKVLGNLNKEEAAHD